MSEHITVSGYTEISEADINNMPTYRTVEDACGIHGARLHVQANPWHRAKRLALAFLMHTGLAVFSIIVVLAILVLGLSAMDVVLTWAGI